MPARLFIAVTLLLSVSRAAAQEVTVRVRAVYEGVAIAQAQVVLGSEAQLTSGTGDVVFRVEPGRYALRIERLGYIALADSVMIQRDTVLTFELSPDAIEAEEVIVESTRGERRIQDEPTKVEVVTREEIEEKLLMTPGSISMLLNETSGLRVQETSPALGGAMIRIQGLQGRYTQLLSDGLPLHGGQTGSLGVLQIPPMDLVRVEVIKGAASALYGAAALGGVVNLISRRPEDETELLLNQSTRGGSDAVLWNSRELNERVGYTMLLSGHMQRAQDIDGDEWTDMAEYERLVARPRLFLRSAGGSQVMLTTGAMVEMRDGGGVVGDGSTLEQTLDTRRFDAGGTARLLLSESRMLDFRGSASLTSHDHGYGDVGEEDRHSTMFGEASLRGSNGVHLWVVGAALQRDGYAADRNPAFDYTFRVPSLFAQDEIGFSDRATASLSVRGDWHSEYGAFVAPRAALLLRPTAESSVRVAAGGGYFGPTPFTEETEEVGLVRLVAMEDLKAERAHNVSADVNWSPDSFEANVSLFGSWIRDRVEAIDSLNGLALVNVPGTTETWGVETLLRFSREPFVATASYTFVHATQARFEGGRETVPMVPRHIAGLVAMIEEHDVGRAGLEMYYTGRQQLEDNPFREQSRRTVILGLLVEKRFGRFRTFLNLENLTNVRQSRFDPLIRPEPTSYGRWTTDLWAPVEGRTINGGVRITLN